MEVRFSRLFDKDLAKLGNKVLAENVEQLILTAMAAQTLHDIPGLKKLKGEANSYRARIGTYRVGLRQTEDGLEFCRIMHRKDIYNYFP